MTAPGSPHTDCLLTVHVVPRARRERVQWSAPLTLKIHLTAPPVDNKANRALVDLLAATLRVPRRQVTIVRGTRGRKKSVRVEGLSRDVLEQRLRGLAE